MLFLPKFPLYWVQPTSEKRREYLRNYFVKMLNKRKIDLATVANVLRYK